MAAPTLNIFLIVIGCWLIAFGLLVALFTAAEFVEWRDTREAELIEEVKVQVVLAGALVLFGAGIAAAAWRFGPGI